MDSLSHLNFHYPGMQDVDRIRVPHSGEGSRHSSVNTPSTALDQPLLGGPYSGKTTRAQTTLDRTTDRNSRHQQQRSVTGLRGPVRSGHPNPLPNFLCMDQPSDLLDRYIPSSSDRLTCSDHRPLDQIFGRPQVIATPIRRFQNVPPRPSATVHTYALPTKPQLDGVLQIPLLAVDNRMQGTDLVIDFRCSDWGIGVPVEGIPMSDLLRGDDSGLERPHERVLDGSGIIDLRLNIFWPNYGPFKKTISASGVDGKLLTRAGLGYEVALAFAEFYYVTSLTVQPTQPGPYTIASSRPGSTSPGIRFDQLRLITVRNTSLGEWMAEVRAVFNP